MKSQKAYLIGCGPVFLMVLLAVLQVEVWAESQKKQWVVFHDRIPEGSTRYSIALRYVPSGSTFYSASRSNVESVTLRGGKKTDGYKEKLDFGTAVDGYQYSVLLRDARELCVINRDGGQICKAKILRSKQKRKPAIAETVKEGYFYLGRRIKIPFEVSGRQLNIPTNESVPGEFTIDVYSHDPYLFRGSFSARLKGSLIGCTFIEEAATIEVSVSYKESLKPYDRRVKLDVKPFGEKQPVNSTDGKITDILKLGPVKIAVEKIASDNSEIVLAVIDGDIRQATERESQMRINKPAPAFARVDLIRRQLLTLDKLCRKAGPQGYVVLIFGDLKRQPLEYGRRSRETNKLTLDETMVMETLQRDLDTPPVVVFVCRQFLFSDLYEKWLDQDPGFYIVTDYSNPMDVQFLFSSRYQPPYHRPSVKIETLREQFVLPGNNVSILLVNGEGNLIYIDVDAGQQLAESLARINKLMGGNKPLKTGCWRK